MRPIKPSGTTPIARYGTLTCSSLPHLEHMQDVLFNRQCNMYCQVVKELTNCGAVFRVLALSATPGNDLKVSDDVTWSVVVNPPLSTTGSPAGRLKFTALTH